MQPHSHEGFVGIGPTCGQPYLADRVARLWPERDPAWLAYHDQLYDLSPREKRLVERAFKAGWAARVVT